MYLLVKNLKLTNKVLWINLKCIFLNILKTKCNSVQEKAIFTLSRTLLQLVFKIFKTDKFHVDQKYWFEQFEICHQRMLTFFKNK